MHISDYDYELPERLIALHPPKERGDSRLMVVRRDDGSIEHKSFSDLGAHLDAGDLLVVNDTRVMAARLFAAREGFPGKIEILLVRLRKEPAVWEVLARPARKLDTGTVLVFGESRAKAVVRAVGDEGRRLIEFQEGADVRALMGELGHMPLPPYIAREDEPEDRERYQTVFAKHEGAIAAPTAGLHFTKERLAELAAAGVNEAMVTLHVGPGTFRPVMTEDPREHRIEPEWFEVPEETSRAFAACKAAGKRVVACGTTVVRTLESAVKPGDGGAVRLEPGPGWADLYIYDPYPFQAVDALITNFHLPRSTLLMLVSAFGGLETMRRAYRNAIREGYRFYSYGDAMLIL